MDIKKILKQAIDLHVHVGPEAIPRRFSLPGLLNYEKGKLNGIGVKNHFFPMIGSNRNNASKNGEPFVINSVVLNNYVGGFNADIVRAIAELSERPIIVWFPTLHTKNFLQRQKYEIPKEWLGSKKTKLRLARNIKPLSIFDKDKKIDKRVQEVLRMIKECDAILATGHISWQESYVLVNSAVRKFGIKKIIVTHPIYQKINMPIKIQKELAQRGAFMEQCYSMYSIDKISIKEIARQIKEIGAENCILSSDVGQKFSKSPSEVLADFVLLLEKEGITNQEIKKMLIDNPGKLLN